MTKLVACSWKNCSGPSLKAIIVKCSHYRPLNLSLEIVEKNIIFHHESRNYEEFYNGKTIFNQGWDYNNRGLIGNDVFKIDNRQITKSYNYSPRGFLSAMNRIDSNEPGLLTGHIYDSNGLMSSESKNGMNIPHSLSLNQWNINGVIYDIDTLGRVIKKNQRVFTYGENGRISKVSGDGVNEVDYFYDEENNPILKVYKFGKIAVFLGDNAYVEDSFYEPIKVGTRVVGYFKNGIFVSSSQDHLNTNVIDETGAVNLATAYGERLAPRTDVSEVMDFTLKGFDQDLDAVRMGHRYYDPNAKMFYSADDFFLESPEKILKSPVEGNLYSYAGNEPVGMLDKKGDFAGQIDISANAFLGFLGGEIAPIGLAFAYDPASGKVEYGITSRAQGKMGIGAELSASVNVTVTPNATKISDLSGASAGANVPLPGGLGLMSKAASGSLGIGNDGKPLASATFSLGVGAGANVSAGIGGQTAFKMGEFFSNDDHGTKELQSQIHDIQKNLENDRENKK